MKVTMPPLTGAPLNVTLPATTLLSEQPAARSIAAASASAPHDRAAVSNVFMGLTGWNRAGVRGPGGPGPAGPPRGTYQSSPSTLPSAGWQAAHHVFGLTEPLTRRTLSSIMPTTMPPVCPVAEAHGLQLASDGWIWMTEN